MVQSMLEIIHGDKEFRDAVFALGGYDTKCMGRIMWRGSQEGKWTSC